MECLIISPHSRFDYYTGNASSGIERTRRRTCSNLRYPETLGLNFHLIGILDGIYGPSGKMPASAGNAGCQWEH
jgi:hypothetical protein